MKIVIVLSIAFGIYLLYVIVSGIMIPSWVTRNPLGPESNDYYFNPITKSVFQSSMGNWFSLSYSKIEGITKDSKIQFLKDDVLVADEKIFANGDLLPIKYAPDFQWLPPHYIISDKKVFFRDDFKPTIEMVEADALTFRTIKAFNYAVDSKHVYFLSSVIPDADPKTYKMAKDSYSIGWDDKRVFFRAPKTKESTELDKVYSIPHLGSIFEQNQFIFDSKFVYFFDYKSLKIRQEPYQNSKSVKHVDLGIEIDGRLVPRSEYLSD